MIATLLATAMNPAKPSGLSTLGTSWGLASLATTVCHA